MITHIQAIILGIIEGLTEFLPISSTAHLILFSNILDIANTAFSKTFDIAIQSGAILAVLLFYWKKFLEWETLKKIIVAFIPTAIIGLIFYKIVKTYLLGNVAVVLWALAIGGVLLILFEIFIGKRDGGSRDDLDTTQVRDISYDKSIIIGICQSVAIIPGVSRSAATIVGGMLLGISRKTIVEFSFLLAIPTMAAATGLDLLKSYKDISGGQFSTMAIGFIASFIMALISIKFLLDYIQKHDFKAFGVYRIILAIIFVLIMGISVLG